MDQPYVKHLDGKLWEGTAWRRPPPRRYVLVMVAKPSARVEELLAAAAALAPEERRAFVEGLAVVREHTTAADARHAELLRRVERVRRGEATTLSLDEADTAASTKPTRRPRRSRHGGFRRAFRVRPRIGRT